MTDDMNVVDPNAAPIMEDEETKTVEGEEMAAPVEGAPVEETPAPEEVI